MQHLTNNSMLEKKYRNNSPLVSLLIITYNQAHFVHETLRSALEQDYENIEIVVADDGSIDGTVDIILEYARQYPGKIVPLTGGSNLGITGNSNRGLLACQGKYVAFMGGDDVLLPQKISAQVNKLESFPSFALCYHDVEVFDSTTGSKMYNWFDRYRYRMGGAETVVKFGTFFCATSVMIRKPTNVQLRFNDQVPVASDWLFWFDVLETQNGALTYVDATLARYRRHDANVTSNKSYHLHDMLMSISFMKASGYYRNACRQKEAQIYFMDCVEKVRQFRLKSALQMFFLMMRTCHCMPVGPARLLVSKLFRLKL